MGQPKEGGAACLQDQNSTVNVVNLPLPLDFAAEKVVFDCKIALDIV